MEFTVKGFEIAATLLLITSAFCVFGMFMQFLGTMDERTPEQNAAGFFFFPIVIFSPKFKDKRMLESSLFKRKVFVITFLLGILCLLIHRVLQGSVG